MRYCEMTAQAARQLVERHRVAAVKKRNQFNKIRGNEGRYECRGLQDPSGWITAGQSHLIWFEISEELSELSNEISSELQPTESQAKVLEFADQAATLETLIEKEFPDLYKEAKKANLTMPELVIYVLGKAIEK